MVEKTKLEKGELLEPFQLKEIVLEHLESFRRVSILTPLLPYHITDENIQVLDIEKKGKEFAYHLPESSKVESFSREVHEQFDERTKKKVDPTEVKRKIEGWIRDSLLRCGLCEHGNLEGAMRFIKNYDDIILAPDTNILLDCVITSVLLPKIEEKIDEEIKGCPNWILISIPKLVMNEVERKAIQKFSFKEFPAKVGWPKYSGRIGQRALQEILELDTNITLRGLSLMTVGEIPTTFDSFKDDPTRLDSEIRAQIRDFISDISFHKGVFFLTQDRVNAMMARSEGLQSLYLQKPEYDELTRKELTNEDIDRVLYEMAVTFGEVKIEGLGKLSIFWPEKHVIDWEKSRVSITEVY